MMYYNESWIIVHNESIFQAIIHPDTGAKIFMPFRMSGKLYQFVVKHCDVTLICCLWDCDCQMCWSVYQCGIY